MEALSIDAGTTLKRVRSRNVESRHKKGCFPEKSDAFIHPSLPQERSRELSRGTPLRKAGYGQDKHLSVNLGPRFYAEVKASR